MSFRQITSGTGQSGDPFIVSGGYGSTQPNELVYIVLPIELMAQYAPTISPGVNSQFCDIGVTLERGNVTFGSITCTFYNRNDIFTVGTYGDAFPYGQFDSDQGYSRIAALDLLEPGIFVLTNAYLYYDYKRFATPAERSQDQVMAVKLTTKQALAPLAIKSVAIDYNEGGKVKQ